MDRSMRTMLPSTVIAPAIGISSRGHGLGRSRRRIGSMAAAGLAARPPEMTRLCCVCREKQKILPASPNGAAPRRAYVFPNDTQYGYGAMAQRQLKLGAVMRPVSIHTGAWRY